MLGSPPRAPELEAFLRDCMSSGCEVPLDYERGLKDGAGRLVLRAAFSEVQAHALGRAWL